MAELPKIVDINKYQLKNYCRGLFQTQIEAKLRIRQAQERYT